MPDFNSPFRRSRQFPPSATELLLTRAQKLLPNDPPQTVQAPELRPLSLKKLDSASPDTLAAPVRDELKYGQFQLLPLSVGVSGDRYLLAPGAGTRRIYLFVLNTHALNTLYLNFGTGANTLTLPLAPVSGYQEYNIVVPQNDIFLLGSGAATTGVLIYANGAVPGY